MSPWGKKRKLIVYLIILLLIIILAISYYVKNFIKPPTCFDNKKNGDEKGVDCGGSCALICKNNFTPINIKWAKAIEISNNIYNIAALVENTNKKYEINFDYAFDIYSTTGTSIAHITNKTKLLPQEKKVIFIQHKYLGKNKIKDTYLKPANQKAFISSEKKSNISHVILSKSYKVDRNIPTLTTTIANHDTEKSKKLQVTGILYDNNHNIINFSSSIIDPIPKGKNTTVYLTWQKPFKKKVSTFAVYVHNLD